MVFDRLNKKVRNIVLAFTLLGVSICPQIANVASVSAQSANPDININASFDPNITPTQRTLLIKAIRNWDSIITRYMVNQGRVNIYSNRQGD